MPLKHKPSRTGKKNRTISCPLCDFSISQDRAIIRHLRLEHNLEGESKQLYIDLVLDGKTPLCACGCGEETRFNNWKDGFSQMQRGHNGNLSALYDEEEIERIKEQRKQTYREHLESGEVVHWAIGQTKETNPSIAKATKARNKTVRQQFDSGERQAWSKGLTKETDSRLAAYSERQKRRFASGERRPWAEGKTKETDAQVAKMAETMSKVHSDPELRARLDAQKILPWNIAIKRFESFVDRFKLLSDEHEYKGFSRQTLRFECCSCDFPTVNSFEGIMHHSCRNCGQFGSSQQSELYHFIRSLCGDVQPNDKNLLREIKQEIDMYVPSKNFAVEFNGVYFHSEAVRGSKLYHANKTKICMNKGVRLFHIFEDEWYDRPNVIRSMIREQLDKSETVIDASSCKIIELQRSERKAFFEEHHIEGDASARLALALEHPECGIVACMSLQKSKKREWRNKMNVARFCAAKNIMVTGALRMLSLSGIDHPKLRYFNGLINWLDERFGTVDQWQAAGWNTFDTRDPEFWWVDNKRRYTQAQLNRISVKPAQAGYNKIWGCKRQLMVFDR